MAAAMVNPELKLHMSLDAITKLRKQEEQNKKAQDVEKQRKRSFSSQQHQQESNKRIRAKKSQQSDKQQGQSQARQQGQGQARQQNQGQARQQGQGQARQQGQGQARQQGQGQARVQGSKGSQLAVKRRPAAEGHFQHNRQGHAGKRHTQPNNWPRKPTGRAWTQPAPGTIMGFAAEFHNEDVFVDGGYVENSTVITADAGYANKSMQDVNSGHTGHTNPLNASEGLVPAPYFTSLPMLGKARVPEVASHDRSNDNRAARTREPAVAVATDRRVSAAKPPDGRLAPVQAIQSHERDRDPTTDMVSSRHDIDRGGTRRGEGMKREASHQRDAFVNITGAARAHSPGRFQTATRERSPPLRRRSPPPRGRSPPRGMRSPRRRSRSPVRGVRSPVSRASPRRHHAVFRDSRNTHGESLRDRLPSSASARALPSYRDRGLSPPPASRSASVHGGSKAAVVPRDTQGVVSRGDRGDRGGGGGVRDAHSAHAARDVNINHDNGDGDPEYSPQHDTAYREAARRTTILPSDPRRTATAATTTTTATMLATAPSGPSSAPEPQGEIFENGFIPPPTAMRVSELASADMFNLRTVVVPGGGVSEQLDVAVEDVAAAVLGINVLLSREAQDAGELPVVLPFRQMLRLRDRMRLGEVPAAADALGRRTGQQAVLLLDRDIVRRAVQQRQMTDLLEYGRDIRHATANWQRQFDFLCYQLANEEDWSEIFAEVPQFYSLTQEDQNTVLANLQKRRQLLREREQLQKQQEKPLVVGMHVGVQQLPQAVPQSGGGGRPDTGPREGVGLPLPVSSRM